MSQQWSRSRLQARIRSGNPLSERELREVSMAIRAGEFVDDGESPWGEEFGLKAGVPYAAPLNRGVVAEPEADIGGQSAKPAPARWGFTAFEKRWQ